MKLGIELGNMQKILSKYNNFVTKTKKENDMHDLGLGLDLGKKVQVEQLIMGIKAGRLNELQMVIRQAKDNPKNPIYRMMLTELNILSASENEIPEKYREEFKTLLAEFIEVLKK